MIALQVVLTLKSVFILYLAAVNLTGFCLFSLDKRRAVRGRWRIPERTLLLSALAGGSVGALAAMLLFHHKTRKPKFYLGVPACLLLHAAVAVWWFLIRTPV